MRLRTVGSDWYGRAELHAVGLGQCAVQLWTGTGAGQHVDAQGLAGGAFALHAAGQRRGKLLGIARAGKSAHANLVAVANQRCGFVGAHDALPQFVIQNPVVFGSKNCHKCLFWNAVRIDSSRM